MHRCMNDLVLVVCALASGGSESEPVREALIRLRRSAAHRCGELDVKVDPDDPTRKVGESRVCCPYADDPQPQDTAQLAELRTSVSVLADRVSGLEASTKEAT